MISDIVCEQLVKKKFETRDYIKAGLIVLACLGGYALICVAALIFVPDVFFYLLPYAVILLVGAIALCVALVKKTSYEYEYIFVNGELSIDKIVAKSKRTRLLTVELKNVENLGKYNSAKFAGKRDLTKLVYSETYSGEGDVFFEVRHPKIGMTLLVFEPNEKMVKAMKPYLNRSMFRETFPELG